MRLVIESGAIAAGRGGNAGNGGAFMPRLIQPHEMVILSSDGKWF